MRVWKTLAALLILLVLGGALYYLNQQPAKESPGVIPKEKLFSFSPDQVEEFTLQSAGEPAAIFRRRAVTREQKTHSDQKGSSRSPADWEIVSPAGVAADMDQVRWFLEDLPNLQGIPLDHSTEGSLAEFGLEHPRKQIQFRLHEGQSVTLSMGDENPSGYARYGLVSTSPTVYLLDSIETTTLNKTLFDLRDKRVLPMDMAQAQRLELRIERRAPERVQREAPPATIGMSKLRNGNWQLSEPAVRTDYGNANHLATILTGGLMKSIEEEHPASLSPYGLDRPALRLVVFDSQGSHSLLVGNRKSGRNGESGEADQLYYAKNSHSSQVFTINQILYDTLNQDVSAYRNRYLFDFQTSQVTRLEIAGPSGAGRYVKIGERWVRDGASGTAVERTKLEVFLNSVHALRIQHYSSDAAGRWTTYGLDQPWLTITVSFGEEHRQETVLFARRNQRFYAARRGEPAVYELGSNEWEALASKLKEIV